MSDAMIRMLAPYKDKVHTLTLDNGSEFIEHERVGKHLDADTYFAAPYASWERGTHDNTNGLSGQFSPKRIGFNNITETEIQEAVTLLNPRPRKTRGYLTPYEIFTEGNAA